MSELPNEIKEMAGIDDKLAKQIRPRVIPTLVKIYHGQALTMNERDFPINAVEAAVVISINSKRPISHRYVKEIARPRDGKRRLTPVEYVGSSQLYPLGDVYDLPPVTEKKRGEDSGSGVTNPSVVLSTFCVSSSSYDAYFTRVG